MVQMKPSLKGITIIWTIKKFTEIKHTHSLQTILFVSDVMVVKHHLNDNKLCEHSKALLNNQIQLNLLIAINYLINKMTVPIRIELVIKCHSIVYNLKLMWIVKLHSDNNWKYSKNVIKVFRLFLVTQYENNYLVYDGNFQINKSVSLNFSALKVNANKHHNSHGWVISQNATNK